MRTSLIVAMLAALMTPLACDDQVPDTTDAPTYSILEIIAELGDEEVLHSRPGIPYVPTLSGDRAHHFGEGLYGLSTEPGFVAGWAMLVQEEEDTPTCKGKGVGFARCVKKAMDKGLECRTWKEGDEYVAYCEERKT